MTEYFEKNKDGKVEFTENALKALLDKVYNQGYNDGKNTGSIIWNSPSKWYDDWWNKPYPHITWSTSSSSTPLNYCDSTITNTSTEEEEESHIGDVILDCPICHSKIYKNSDEVDT